MLAIEMKHMAHPGYMQRRVHLWCQTSEGPETAGKRKLNVPGYAPLAKLQCTFVK